MYAYQTNLDLTAFLRTNYYTLLITGFGIGMVSIIMLIVSLIDTSKAPQDSAKDPKWGQ